MHDVSRLLRKEYDRRVKELGVTRSQWRVIVHLYRSEGVTQTELAELLEIENATLGRLLDRLEAANWVERRPCDRDRRANRLYLSDKPATIIDDMFSISSVLEQEALSGLTLTEQDALIDWLLAIKRNLLDLNNVDTEQSEPEAVRRVASGG